MHHFYVEIPAAPRDAVSFYDDFGFDGDEARRETVECRLILARELWTKIRDDARRDFNARLKTKKTKRRELDNRKGKVRSFPWQRVMCPWLGCGTCLPRRVSDHLPEVDGTAT